MSDAKTPAAKKPAAKKPATTAAKKPAATAAKKPVATAAKKPATKPATKVAQSAPAVTPAAAPAAVQAPPAPPAAPAAAAPMTAVPVASSKTNILAIISLVTAIVGFSPVAIVTGFIALSQIKKSNEEGRGLAIAGLIVGFAGTVVGIIVAAVFFVPSFLAYLYFMGY